ncbi:TonB-dependent receptor [bacterium]|nr:TonB-dependent receptor [candidate division CSSED10-310 bacterium]
MKQVCVFGMIVACCIATVRAEDMPDRSRLPVFDLGSIEVVGKLEPVETAATEKVTAEENTTRMIEDMAQAISRIPGVNLTVGSKNETQFMIRGLYQERVLVLMDGVPMSAPYYGDLDSAEIPLDNLEEIKVIRGNASVLYGPNAMGGVVSLVSPKPGDTPNFRLMSTLDQEGNYFGRLTHGQRLGGFYYQVSAGIRESDGWPMADDFDPVISEDGDTLEDGDIRKNSQFSQWSGSLKAGYEWEKSEVTLSGSFIDAEKGIPPTTDLNDRARYRFFPEWQKGAVTLAGRSWLSESVELRANAFYHQYDNVLRDYRDPDYSELSWESTYDDYSTGMNARLSWDASESWTLRAAVHAIRDNHESQADTSDPWEEYAADTYAAAFQADWKASDRIMLQAGISYDVYDFDTVKNIPGSTAAIASRSKDADDMTWTTLAQFHPADAHVLTLAISQKLQLPTMNQLFSNIEEFEPQDVTTLDPETALEYSVSYEFTPGTDFTMGITGFYYDIKDMITRPDRDGLFINLDSAEITGVETWLAYEPSTGFTGSLSYSYTDAEETTSLYGSRTMEYVPDSIVHADAGYRFGFGTSITVAATWRDDVIDYDDDAPRNVPDYSLIDATVRHDFDFGLGLMVKVSNVTDENYYQEIGFPLPGRNILLGLSFAM